MGLAFSKGARQGTQSQLSVAEEAFLDECPSSVTLIIL